MSQPPIIPSGLVGDGTGDNSAAIQTALNTGQTVYLPAPAVGYRLGAPITFSAATGQKMYGDGQHRPTLLVDSGFQQGASGVVVCEVATAPELRDFEIDFAQPDTSSRAALSNYPPAIYAQGVARAKFHDLRIQNATIGLDLRGNAGGSEIVGIDLSAYSYGVMIDGAQDTIKIHRLHNVSIGMTPNQMQIFADPGTIGLWVGRADALQVSNSTFLAGMGVRLLNNGNGAANAHFAGCGFDSHNGINLTAGTVSVAGGYFSTDLNYRAINITGWGVLHVAGAHFFISNLLYGTPSYPAVSGNPNIYVGGDARLTLSACGLDDGNSGTDRTFIYNEANVNAFTTVTGCEFQRAPMTYANPTIHAAGGRVTLIGNTQDDIGPNGNGTFIQVDQDNNNVAIGNSANGWAMSFPPQPQNGYYVYNVAGSRANTH
jgi:hypothetical protein